MQTIYFMVVKVYGGGRIEMGVQQEGMLCLQIPALLVQRKHSLFHVFGGGRH